MRRTDDGFDPLEVAGDGQKCEGPKIQEILFFLRTEILCAWVKNCKESAGRSWRMFWPYAFFLSDFNLWIKSHQARCKVHVDVTILQHKLGRAALACRKTVAAPGERRKQNPFQRSMWKWPVLRGSPTQHYTLHYTQHYTLHCTQHYRTAGRGNILELSCFEGMKWKYKSVFLSWPEMLPLAAFR